MKFKAWLETYQKAMPFLQQDDPLDQDQLKKIQRYKSKENYVKAMQRGGRKTELSAEKMISQPIGSWFVGDERIVNYKPNAIIIPERKLKDGHVLPKIGIAMVHLETEEPINSTNPQFANKHRYRILAFWQGPKIDGWTPKDIQFGVQPLGGASGFGGYLDTFWVAPDMSKEIPLYKEIRKFAAEIGYPALNPKDRPGARQKALNNLKPGEDADMAASDTELTSKSFRGAQAKYDWDRAQAQKSGSGGS